jgi:hypothetical protein
MKDSKQGTEIKGRNGMRCTANTIERSTVLLIDYFHESKNFAQNANCFGGGGGGITF